MAARRVLKEARWRLQATSCIRWCHAHGLGRVTPSAARRLYGAQPGRHGLGWPWLKRRAEPQFLCSLDFNLNSSYALANNLKMNCDFLYTTYVVYIYAQTHIYILCQYMLIYIHISICIYDEDFQNLICFNLICRNWNFNQPLCPDTNSFWINFARTPINKFNCRFRLPADPWEWPAIEKVNPSFKFLFYVSVPTFSDCMSKTSPKKRRCKRGF